MDELSQLRLTPRMVRLVAAIDEFKGQWRALGDLAPERLAALRQVATIESIGSSTRIEGAALTNDEVDALLCRLDVESFRSRDEQEVAGYARAMDLVFSGWSEIPLTESHVKQIHQELLRYSTKDAQHRGQYKTLPNDVVMRDASGETLAVVFSTASPFETPARMRELTHETRLRLERADHHPLLIIAGFVVRFLAIHPFQDGNGRVSRVLTTLLLLRSGYTYVPFSSLERVIEDNKSDYYRALRAAQGTLSSGNENLGQWVEFFLDCLNAQKARLERRLKEQQIVASLSPLDLELLSLARVHGRLTVKLATEALGANRNTVKSRVSKLVRSGHLQRHGQKRGTWYEAVSE